jgi:hypothetical protein
MPDKDNSALGSYPPADDALQHAPMGLGNYLERVTDPPFTTVR